MSNNIWGYQGLQTPLENLTNGNYNVADYTNMRREFSARIQALENAGGFIPTNVNIQGYCNIVPGTNGYGNFSATGATILGGTLNVAQTATFQGGMTVSGTLSIANVSAGAVSASSATVSGNITSTAGQFIGNGAGLTGVVATDNTKLPLTGGTMTGSLSTQTVSVISGYNVFNYKVNKFTNFANTNAGPFTVLQQNSSVHDYVRLTGTVACTVNLANLIITGSQFYQDGQRLVTITKCNNFLSNYTVTVNPPTGYLFFTLSNAGSSSYFIAANVFSVTFMISNVGGSNIVDMISNVN
jgi:hypothetical protein